MGQKYRLSSVMKANDFLKKIGKKLKRRRKKEDKEKEDGAVAVRNLSTSSESEKELEEEEDDDTTAQVGQVAHGVETRRQKVSKQETTKI